MLMRDANGTIMVNETKGFYVDHRLLSGKTTWSGKGS